MNARLIKECIIQLGAYLRRQDAFDRDINAYGWYYLDPPEFSVAIPSIVSIHTLDEFPWPERRCLLICPLPVTMPGNQGGVVFYVHDDDVPGLDVIFGLTTYEPHQDTELNRRGDFGSKHDITTNFRTHYLCSGLEKSDYSTFVDEKFFTEISKKVFFYEVDQADLFAKLVKAALDASPTSIWTFGDIDTTMIEDDLDRDDFIVLLAKTLHFLWDCSPLVSPTGYKVKARPQPFGPGWLRKTFVNKPIFSIINHDRLYRMYEASKPQDDGDVPRFTPLHHRRRHVRHLWSRAGIRLRDLPREPDRRQLLVLERNVQRVMVKDCWVGSRQFTLDGFDFEVEEDCS